MMRLTRYRLSGSTQRKGMTATSWQIRLVVARSMTDANAASKNHRDCVHEEGGADAANSSVEQASGEAAEMELFRRRSAQNIAPAKKTRYPALKIHACVRSPKRGSKKIG